MLGILSDAHGNGPAFSLAIKLLRKLGATRFVFLGDAIGYLPSIEVVSHLISLGSDVRCVKGNHEQMLLADNPDTSKDNVYNLSTVKKSLNFEAFNFIKSWPTHIIETFKEKKVLFIHGSPLDYTNGYLYPDTDLSQFDESFDYVFMGHSHYPFIRKHGKVCYVNVGSSGMPRDDGRFGSAAIFDPDTGDTKIIRYDITEITQELLTTVLPIHDSVKANFDRRRDTIYGEIIK